MAYLFVAASIVCFWGIVIAMPKRLPWSEQYACALFALLFNILVDMFFDVGYNFYGYFSKGADWQTLIFLFGVFPPLSMIFLNFYPEHRRWFAKVLYVLMWVGISVFYEWLSLTSGLLYYNQWRLWYSAVMYPAILVVALVNLHVIRTIRRREAH